MESRKFDTLSKALASDTPRRNLLRGMIVGAFAALGIGQTGAAQSGGNGNGNGNGNLGSGNGNGNGNGNSGWWNGNWNGNGNSGDNNGNDNGNWNSGNRNGNGNGNSNGKRAWPQAAMAPRFGGFWRVKVALSWPDRPWHPRCLQRRYRRYRPFRR